MSEANNANVLAVLVAARKRIETPDRWTSGTFARNNSGERVHWSDQSACAWCATGAILAELPDGSGKPNSVLRRAIGTNNISKWNDAPKRTHAEVLTAFDRAIAMVSP